MLGKGIFACCGCCPLLAVAFSRVAFLILSCYCLVTVLFHTRYGVNCCRVRNAVEIIELFTLN